MSLLRQINAWLFDSVGTPFVLDKSGHVSTVTEVQNAVHDGLAFSYSINATGLANGGTVSFLFRTGAKQVHFDGLGLDVSVAPVSITLHETPTVTTTGTLQTTRRRNRINTTVSLTTVYLNPTVSAVGTILDSQLIVNVSNGSNKVAGTASVEGGWVLKANTDYYILMTNSSGSSINYNMQFAWHEANYNV